MELERLAKDGNSGDFGCPAVYLAEDGTFVVQGNVLDATTAGNMENVLPGEAGVSIAPEVVVEAVRRYSQRG